MNVASTRDRLLRVAVPVPLRRLFDYLPPENAGPVQPGVRVRVPFARREVIGVVVDLVDSSETPAHQLKAASEVIDQSPLLPADSLELLQWVSAYYQAPPGEALAGALPVALRGGKAADSWASRAWRLTTEGKGLPRDGLARAPRQQALLQLLLDAGQIGKSGLDSAGITTATVKALKDKGLVEEVRGGVEPPPLPAAQPAPPPELNDEQRTALEAVAFGRFSVALLEGTTGSGKTEVYLRLIEQALARGEQALLLVPEIGLTPQTLRRIAARFEGVGIAALHSGLSDGERAQGWLAAASGSARILVGTRSAVFTPLPELGLVIVDEEHDQSFKQQDGVRYHGRDVAIKLAHRRQVPVLLGSATPALESLHNALSGRYQLLQLTQRAGAARPPQISLVPTRGIAMVEGFAPDTLRHIDETLTRGEQVLVFINRRGFAPTLACEDCGWMADCPHCSSHLTLHRGRRHLRCHHCDFVQPQPHQCPQCFSAAITALGAGTERSELMLQQRFGQVPVIRIDRDTTSSKQAMEELLRPANAGKPCLLVGTQMLAKGHHLPRVTLVVIQDADGGLFSADFRGAERTGQLLEQVAGRAGRGELAGKVLVQTRYPEHPLLQLLLSRGYGAYARHLLSERQLTGLPPHTAMALIRADSEEPQRGEQFLQSCRQQLEYWQPPATELQYLGPVPALLERKSGRFRFYLQLTAADRVRLQKLLAPFCQWAEGNRFPGVRWSIDMDAQDL
ncbi:primosomal protein N' [Biformimicrobium ophioploci]|uniref:Replication restart protein PriA n=1 Tax=Biformimicrobium ophioploci TaxID=3036711 RepID=A0ABQ6LVU7_9GAMM|nr:primosomal protein N' [Microbulbifer sp. NKW57]GMG86205.1 primosomal protein N' [Microbulbifer sp. NKW57]